MKKLSLLNKTETKEDAACCEHHPGGRHLFMGLVLFVIGAAFKYGYGTPDVLMLVGALFIVKGFHILLMKKKRNK